MSSIVYHKRDTTYRDHFVYVDSSGAGVTGVSSWTVQLAKNTANQAVAGVTITEVSAGSNPGLYAVTVDAALGFPASNGDYNIMIYPTGTPTVRWEQDIVVNTDGAPSTAGVSFTAVASNGRAMAGGNPLPDATVVITSGSTVFAVFTTDSSGLWGPVYFTTDGTYGITIQAAGYSSATGTITVSGTGTIATGPGTDLALTAVTTNPLSASELWAYFTRQARDVSGTKADTERKQGVQDALDMVAKECQWNWLLRRAYFSLKGAVSYTATLTNGSATVTTASTFATWAAEGSVFASSRVIDVASRDSATQLTLEAPWDGTTGSYTIQLIKDSYDLPDDTLWFHQMIPYQRWSWGGTPMSPEVFLQNQSMMLYGQQFTDGWSVFGGAFKLCQYPTQDATLAYTYYIRPATLTSGTDIADWDPAQIELLRRAIDLQVVVRYGSCAGGDAPTIIGRYKEALARARASDREPTSAGNALDDADMFDQRLGRTWRQRPRG